MADTNDALGFRHGSDHLSNPQKIVTWAASAITIVIAILNEKAIAGKLARKNTDFHLIQTAACAVTFAERRKIQLWSAHH
jgi:hypothetical protein